MSETYKIILPIRACSINCQYRVGYNKKIYESNQCREFKKAVNELVKDDMKQFYDDDIDMEIKLFFKNKPLDIDNASKSCLDVLEGKLYKNDRQIKRLLVEKFNKQPENKIEIIIRKYVELKQN